MTTTHAGDVGEQNDASFNFYFFFIFFTCYGYRNDSHAWLHTGVNKVTLLLKANSFISFYFSNTIGLNYSITHGGPSTDGCSEPPQISSALTEIIPRRE